MKRMVLITVPTIFFLAVTGGASQTFLPSREYLLANPPPAISSSRPTLPHASTAGMFVRACLREIGPYYSGAQFVFGLDLDEIAQDSSPFLEIWQSPSFSGKMGSIQNKAAVEHEKIYLLRPEFDEYYSFGRIGTANGHEEYCAIASASVTQIALLFDLQKVVAELGFKVGKIREIDGRVEVLLEKTRVGPAPAQFGVLLGSTLIQGRPFSWLVTGRMFY